jgi:phosphopantothenoylcysteine decarboxylase/phosphopantothenate--cysteine ligase
MNFIITAGPTFEPLDQVRRLTNFSTGKLGIELANFLAAKGHQVTLLKGYYAVHTGAVAVARTITFTTTEDLHQRLRTCAIDSVDVVLHAAAVSDFRFGKVYERSASGDLNEVRAGKVPTRAGSLLVELLPTQKIIGELRSWFPKARLVGWKYEVDGTQAEALAKADEQLRRCQTDACVVNGPAYGKGFGFVQLSKAPAHLPNNEALFELLLEHFGRTN